jgi:hypothetical protein
VAETETETEIETKAQDQVTAAPPETTLVIEKIEEKLPKLL